MFFWSEKKTEYGCQHVWQVKEKEVLESEFMKALRVTMKLKMESMPEDFYLDKILIHSFCTLCKTEKVEKL